jgi:hypothetical protein
VHSPREYQARLSKDHRGVDPISDALPFGGLWYAGPNAASNAVSYAKFYSRSHDAVVRVYDKDSNVIDTHRILSIKFKRYFLKRPERMEVTHGACQGQNRASGPEL